RWLARRIGFLAPDAGERIAGASFRPEVEIHRFAGSALAVEARLKQFALEQKSMDFQSFCEESGLVGLPFAERDLRISGVALARAPASRWQAVLVSAVERARAARWLMSPRLVAVRQPVDA